MPRMKEYINVHSLWIITNSWEPLCQRVARESLVEWPARIHWFEAARTILKRRTGARYISKPSSLPSPRKLSTCHKRWPSSRGSLRVGDHHDDLCHPAVRCACRSPTFFATIAFDFFSARSMRILTGNLIVFNTLPSRDGSFLQLSLSNPLNKTDSVGPTLIQRM